MKNSQIYFLALILVLGAAGIGALSSTLATWNTVAFIAGLIALAVAVYLFFLVYPKNTRVKTGDITKTFVTSLLILTALVSTWSLLAGIYLILTTAGALGWTEMVACAIFGFVALVGFRLTLKPKARSLR